MKRGQWQRSEFIVVVPATSVHDGVRVFTGSDGKVQHVYSPRSADLNEASQAARLSDLLYQRMRRWATRGDLGAGGPNYWTAPDRRLPLFGGGPDTAIQWSVANDGHRDQVIIAGFARKSLAPPSVAMLAAGILEVARMAGIGLVEQELGGDLDQLRSQLGKGDAVDDSPPE